MYLSSARDFGKCANNISCNTTYGVFVESLSSNESGSWSLPTVNDFTSFAKNNVSNTWRFRGASVEQ